MMQPRISRQRKLHWLITNPHRMRNIITLVLLLCGFQGISQQHCCIKYTYDAAGNRTQREWHCGPAGPDEEDPHLDGGGVKSLGLDAMPNPANEHFALRSKEALENALCELIDTDGRTILTQRMNGTAAEFNVTGIGAGIYVLRARIENEEYMTRISIAH